LSGTWQFSCPVSDLTDAGLWALQRTEEIVMLKVHVLSNARARRRASKGFALAAIIVTAIIVLGASSLGSLGDRSVRALTDASANTSHATTLDRARAMPVKDAAQGAGRQGDLDYFPDHYRNQATEPAEPIATF
jgi:hypothetical protein